MQPNGTWAEVLKKRLLKEEYLILVTLYIGLRIRYMINISMSMHTSLTICIRIHININVRLNSGMVIHVAITMNSTKAFSLA